MKLHKTITLSAAALGIMLLSSGNVGAAIIVTQPPGLNVGDQYHLAFVTSDTGTATSTDIADYNAFVTTAAVAVPELAALGTNWSVIGSTSTVSARDNTGTRSSGGLPIFLLSGDKLVDNYDDLWDGSVDAPLNQTELGTALSDFSQVHTGMYFTGEIDFNPLGHTRVDLGYVHSTDSAWAWVSNNSPDTLSHFYAMSAPLTVVPEPCTMALLGMGGLGLLIRRRRKAKA